MVRTRQWDGPVWGGVLVVTLLAFAMGFLGVAASKLGPETQAEILTTDNCPPPAEL